jgi:ABC-type uncharacterized transport system permease subunit
VEASTEIYDMKLQRMVGHLPGLIHPNPKSVLGIGFLALLVVLLVSIRVLWVPIVTLIFALLLGGSAKLKIDLKLDASLVGVMQDTVVLIVLLFNGLRQRLQDNRQKKDHTKPTSITATVENQRVIGDTTE